MTHVVGSGGWETQHSVGKGHGGGLHGLTEPKVHAIESGLCQQSNRHCTDQPVPKLGVVEERGAQM